MNERVRHVLLDHMFRIQRLQFLLKLAPGCPGQNGEPMVLDRWRTCTTGILAWRHLRASLPRSLIDIHS